MLLTIGIVLIVLWLVGFIGFHVVGWFIHVLLVIAVIVILTRIIRGKRIV
ncbi:MAG: lmo0937 family membrane protein [bacterium]|nr:lmo0937 family membrane protein [bacterium]